MEQSKEREHAARIFVCLSSLSLLSPPLLFFVVDRDRRERVGSENTRTLFSPPSPVVPPSATRLSALCSKAQPFSFSLLTFLLVFELETERAVSGSVSVNVGRLVIDSSFSLLLFLSGLRHLFGILRSLIPPPSSHPIPSRPSKEATLGAIHLVAQSRRPRDGAVPTPEASLFSS